MATPNNARHVVVCAVCQEPLGHIMFPEDPNSHQAAPTDWPKKGTMALMGNYLVHVLGEEVHTGRVVLETGLVLGEVGIEGLDSLSNLPVRELRYKGLP